MASPTTHKYLKIFWSLLLCTTLVTTYISLFNLTALLSNIRVEVKACWWSRLAKLKVFHQGMLELQGALCDILGQWFASLSDLVFHFHEMFCITILPSCNEIYGQVGYVKNNQCIALIVIQSNQTVIYNKILWISVYKCSGITTLEDLTK